MIVVLVNLFLVFFKIGLFAVGGAYSFLPLIENEAVIRHQWLTKEEFLDIAGVNQIFPGAISIKYATYTGYKIAGVAGAIFANLGNTLAPAILVVFFSFIYARFKEFPRAQSALEMIRLVVFAMIIAVAFQTVNSDKILSIKSVVIIVLSFSLFIYTKVHPAIVIVLAGIAGIVWK
ncbi:MAG: hypothetical protein A3K83_05880 [Omnitrophica WOR_2 bacterium RBG_13_44_8b]|nr:MAG: hypothetical protein A3K83_05880 [Omnitrophica WOR_2 bacterium RBG_13_44_8b]